MKVADDPLVVKAVGIAVEAGVAATAIDAELREAAAEAQDALTPVVLAGRLLSLARPARGTVAAPSGLYPPVRL